MNTCPTCGTRYDQHVRFCTHDGTVLEDESSPEQQPIGKVLAGKYRLDTALSRGGMGVVYRATHVMLNKAVAVKLIKSDLTVSPEVARRFQREARAASNLNHPNIVAVYDLGQTEDGTLYIAMELVDGPSLKDVIKTTGPVDPPRTVRLLHQVASALAEAHRHGIIHRDLKPHNIMLAPGPDGTEIPKLLDFGIAKTFDEAGTQLTQAGFAIGTPQYMSPEQALGKEVDGRSDLYSLGIILYEMLAGELPFSDNSTSAILVKQVNEVPVPPSTRKPGLEIPAGLEAVALRCLQKDPAGRYQSADEFAAALATSLDPSATTDADLHTMVLPAGTPPTHATIPSVPAPGAVSGVQAGAAAPSATPGTAATAVPQVAPVPMQAGDQRQTQDTRPTAPGPVVPAPSAVEKPAPAAARAKKSTVGIVVFAAAAVLLLAGGLAWQQGWLPVASQQAAQTATAQGAPGKTADVPPGTPAMAPQTPEQTPAQPAAAPAMTEEPSASPAGQTPTPAAPLAAGAAQQAAASRGAAAKQPLAAAAKTGPAELTSRPPTAGAAAPAAHQQAAALSENPAVLMRCSGAPEICTALRTAFQQALQREGMPLVSSPDRADVVIDAEAAITDEQQQQQFGTTFVVRTYSVDLSGECARFSESVPMPEARTFSFDARVGRERANENARVIADGAVTHIRAYWQKKR